MGAKICLTTILYNQFEHNIFTLVSSSKKEWKPKLKPTKWMSYTCIKKCCFKWIFIDSFSLFDVYQVCEGVYHSKLWMVSPIIHNFKNKK